MRIAYVAAGAGGMLCGSCIRDNALAGELRRMGHDALLIPIYTPLRTDEENEEIGRVFYGAINVYLQQKSQLFGRLPHPLRRLLDSPWLLRRIPTDSAVDAKGLGALALSMLEGENGRQRVELEELVDWLRDEVRPEVVHLTNSMLLGLAHRLRERLPGVRLVCALQGEDIFLDDLDEGWREKVIAAMRRRAADCDLFVATSEFYARAMGELLELDADRVRWSRLGVHAGDFGHRDAEPEGVPTIGFLARICPEKGPHLLLEAFRLLCRERSDSVRLRIAGYLGARDRAYFGTMQRHAREWGLADRVELMGEVDRAGKVALLDSLHVFSMPTVYHEPKGLPVLEAMASGVPVVQPAHGAFPELVERAGGGLLVPPGDPEALAGALGSLLDDGELRRRLGARGREGVRRHFTVEAMAADTLAAYQTLF